MHLLAMDQDGSGQPAGFLLPWMALRTQKSPATLGPLAFLFSLRGFSSQ